MNKETVHPKMESIIIKKDGSVVDTVDWYEDVLDLRTFIERMASSFDVNVIFQRDPNWSYEMKAELIRSIMNGTPIGYCLLCEKPTNIAHKNMIDFKNRSLTLRDFWNGEFSVEFRIENEDGTFTSLRATWPEILESTDPRLQNLKEKFQNYKIRCLVYKSMNLVQQSKKFITVNTQLPMENEELLYGYNYWSKGFFRLAHEIILKKLMTHTRAKQERDNIKEKGTIYIHRMMYICYGPTLNDSWAVRDLGNSKTGYAGGSNEKPFVRGTHALNEILANFLDKKNASKLDQTILEGSPYWERIKSMKQCCNSLHDIFKYNNATSKKLLKNDIFDCVVFFMKKLRENRLTISMMNDNPSLYFGVVREFINRKGQDPALTGQSVTTKRINERIALFEKVWSEFIEDDGIKKQLPKAHEISMAFLNSPAACPITGECLDDENAKVEHVDSKSKFSNTEFAIVSERGNNWKSNRTLEENEKVIQYQRNYSSVF